MEIRQYFEILRRRMWIVALLVVVAVGGVTYQVLSLTPKHEAEVSLLVTPRVTAPTAFEDAGPTAFPVYREAVLRNVALLIQSREVLQRAADRLGDLSAEHLRRRTQVEEVRGSDFVLIKAQHDEPERAALIANTVAQEFVNFYVEVNRTEASQSQQFVELELGRAQNTLQAAERALLEFKNQADAVSLTGEASKMALRLLDLQSVYETAALDERTARSRLDAIRVRLRSHDDPRLASVSIATNPIIAQLRSNLTTLELELAGLRQQNTDEHPKVKELLGRIADVRERLRAEGLKVVKDESLGVSPIREQLVRDMVTTEIDGVVARAKAAGILQQREGMQAALRTMPQSELTLARLERDVKMAEEMYVRLSTLYQEAVIRENKAGASGQAAIVVVDRAKVPDWPVSNQLPLKAGFAGLAALLVGAALAFIVDSMDDRIRSSGEAEGAYGVPVLASIPMVHRGTNHTLRAWPKVTAFLLPIIAVLLGLAMGAGVLPVRIAPDHLARSRQILVQKLPRF